MPGPKFITYQLQIIFFLHNFDHCFFVEGRRSGLMVSALVSVSSGPGSSPGRGHCVVFVGKALLLSRCLSPARCINGYWQI